MSTRWYPLYQKGNPQLRIFLPNFWMKLIKRNDLNEIRPKNHIAFIVSMDMTRYDVKNYLQKIYNVHPVTVNTEIRMGLTKQVGDKRQVVKEDDYKMAFVTLVNNHNFTNQCLSLFESVLAKNKNHDDVLKPDDQTFEFPDIYPKEKSESMLNDEKKQLESIKKSATKNRELRKEKPGLPGWFS